MKDMGLNDHIIGAKRPQKRNAFEPTAYGDYLLLERVYVDRICEVFLAKAFGDVGAGLLVDVKRFAPFFFESDPQAVEFLDQLGEEAGLDHQNICRIIDTGFVDGQIFAATEHTPGIDLSAILEAIREGRQIPWPIAVCIIIEVLRALHAAHASTAIHKCLSPSRVLVCHDGRVNVKDFSHARTHSWVVT